MGVVVEYVGFNQGKGRAEDWGQQDVVEREGRGEAGLYFQFNLTILSIMTSE